MADSPPEDVPVLPSPAREPYEKRAAEGRLAPMGLQILKVLREKAAEHAILQPRESLSDAVSDLPPQSEDLSNYIGGMDDPRFRAQVEEMRKRGYKTYPWSMERTETDEETAPIKTGAPNV